MDSRLRGNDAQEPVIPAPGARLRAGGIHKQYLHFSFATFEIVFNNQR
jgi:hypothetical protein